MRLEREAVLLAVVLLAEYLADRQENDQRVVTRPKECDYEGVRLHPGQLQVDRPTPGVHHRAQQCAEEHEIDAHRAPLLAVHTFRHALGRDLELERFGAEQGQRGDHEGGGLQEAVALGHEVAEDPAPAQVIGDDVESEIGHPVRQENGKIHLHRQHIEPQDQDRDRDQEEFLEGFPVGQEAGKIGKALLQAEPLDPQRAFLAAVELHRPLRPAQPLEQEGVHGLRGDAERQWFVDEQRLPAAAVQPYRSVDVLRDRGGCDPANIFEGCAPYHRRAAAPERAVAGVLARLNDAEEQRLLVPAACAPGVLDRILVVELLGHLDQRQLFVLEVTQRALQVFRLRHHVGVEHDDEITVGLLQGVVDVARFGMFVRRARDILAAHAVGQL